MQEPTRAQIVPIGVSLVEPYTVARQLHPDAHPMLHEKGAVIHCTFRGRIRPMIVSRTRGLEELARLSAIEKAA